MTDEGVCEGMRIVGISNTYGRWMDLVRPSTDPLSKKLYHHAVAELRRAGKHASKWQCTCWFRTA